MNIDINYIKKVFAMIDNNTISVDHLIVKICHDYNITKTESVTNELRDIIIKYKKKEIDSSGVESLLNNLNFNEQTDNPGSVGGGGLQQPSTPSTPRSPSTPNEDSTSDSAGIIDVDTDVIEKVSASLTDVEETVSSNEIQVPASVAEYASGVESAAESGKQEINSGLNEIKGEVVEKIQSVIETDNSIKFDGFKNPSFKDIWEATHKLNLNKLVPADASFFAQNPDCKINGNLVTYSKDGNTYTYDLKTKKFTCNGSVINKLGIYVPSGVTDYSKLNTFTYFVQDNFDKTTQYPSNAIVIRVLKTTVQSGGKFNKHTEVVGATRFINGVARTDRNNCQNIIGGDSVYGAHSLKLAASNGNLYDTIYCVNNGALVTGENAKKGEKEQFASLADLKKLNGKNIYFISATGDPNLASCYGSKGAMTPCSFDQSYTYRGAELVARYCPNAKVYAVYGGTEAKPGIQNLYRNLDRRYNNFTYLENEWNNMVKGNYHSHTDGAKLMSDLVAAVPTNVNNYSA